MGRHACRVAAGFRVNELVIADIDGKRADRLAAELGPPATSLALDVTDEAGLTSALARADVVVNTIGPFFRFGLSVLTAALRAGCHYLDICDDWEPTQEMLDLHETAARSGVTAIVGAGASPGITNLLAVVAARELDSVSEIVTGWNVDAAQPERDAGARPSAALVHGIRQMTGTIRVQRGGRLADEAPLQRVSVAYPGLGPRPLWTFGHPEPITLARAFGDLTFSVNAVHGGRGTLALMRSMREAVDRDLLSADRALLAASWAERHFPAPRPLAMFRPTRLPPLFGHAAGWRQGRPASAGAALCRLPGATMGAVTGTALAVALKLLAEGSAREPGVHAPEAILDPDEFFAALAAYCPGRPAVGEMISVTRSWDTDARDKFRAAALGARRWISDAADAGNRPRDGRMAERGLRRDRALRRGTPRRRDDGSPLG
jgi:saccharopine dehydrogenase-like NADP-dependent oxidoreductase